MQGFIYLHRKMLDNPIICKDNDHIAVWIYLLLNATHKGYDVIFEGERFTLKPGQLITGRKSIASKLKINESKVQRILKKFESEQQIEQQTTSRNRLISILNWSIYQNNEQQIEQQVNNNRTTSEQQVNTNNNVNNGDNEKKSNTVEVQKVIELYRDKLKHLPQPRKITDERKKHINARINEYGIDEVVSGIDKASRMKFLAGDNKRGWKADIDWIFQPTNFAKILEEKYASEPPQKKPLPDDDNYFLNRG